MRRDDKYIPELVSAAQAGDGRARERLVAGYLPLVYNIVGRALDGHADVDDVVQETMFRALDGLGGLREPSSFRSWLVAIAMNQIRQRWAAQQAMASLDRAVEAPDPAGDFVDLTILRLGLSGQRREVAEATRWLDPADRQLLSLWWQEAAGQLTRTELAEALGVTPQHAAVRIQRMKAQLDVGRVVVRALAAEPYCEELALITATWEGRPAPVWRKRIARHVRECAACSGRQSDLVPVEGLLAGLALVVPLYTYLTAPTGHSAVIAATGQSGMAPAAGGTGQHGVVVQAGGTGQHGMVVQMGGAGQHGVAGSAGGPGGGHIVGRIRHAGKARVTAAVGGTAGAVLLATLLWPTTQPPASHPGEHRPVAAPSSSPAVRISGLVMARRTLRQTARPAASPERRLIALINTRRAQDGCAPLRMDPRLSLAALRHAKDMVAHGYFDHTGQDGHSPADRISATGYGWSMWAENLDRGTTDPAAAFKDWMDGSMHQDNMLNCQYRDTGVAAVLGPEGTVWVQDLAKPA